uniref:46 kDa salivary protein n=1 Tax=Phlebotomus arabicus TaxID=578135 RepID=C6G4F0_9DIPT
MKLLITIGAVCVLQVVTVSSVFFPIPINIQTGTTSSSSGQPGQQVTTSINFSNVSNITDMVIYLTQNISRALLTHLPDPEDIESAADILEKFTEDLTNSYVTFDDANEEASVTKSRSKRSFLDQLKESQPLKAIRERVDEVKKQLQAYLKPKPQTPSGNQTDTNTTTTETQSRRKRGLSDYIPVNSFKDALSQASAAAGKMMKPPNASLSANASASGSNPLDFLTKISDIGRDLVQNSIKEIASNMASSAALYQVNSKLDAIKQSVNIIQQEIEKTKKVQEIINQALQQAGAATSSFGDKVTSSNCFAQFINPFKLFEGGITCVKNKFDKGIKIATDTLNNISQALSVPSDIKTEVSKCSDNKELNPFTKLLCFLKTPLQLDEEKLLLPIEFVRRIREITEYFATMRMDIIQCGIATIHSIEDKVADCAKEAILAVKDTLMG